MRTILQISPDGAKMTDAYGDVAVSTPEIMLHTFVTWEFDLRSSERLSSGELAQYLPEGLDIANWYFAVDRDYDSSTVPKILITEGITLDTSGETSVLKIPIPQTGTAEMTADMTGQASRKYTAEIGAMDSSARIVITWQFSITVKNRIYAGENVETPPHVTYPDYYTAFETDAKLAAKANAADVYTKTEIDSMTGNIETQLSEI